MNRQEVFDWCRQRYGTEPDYPWNDWNAVLRHTDNNKWYGVIIEVNRSKLGMDETGMVDVLNVKCDPTIIGKKMRKTELKELYKMMFPEYPDIVTVAQLQQMLGVSRHLAYDLINNGYISGVKIGNAFKIPKVNVINYVMEEGVKNAS